MTKAFQSAFRLSFSICVTVRACVWIRHLEKQKKEILPFFETKHLNTTPASLVVIFLCGDLN